VKALDKYSSNLEAFVETYRKTIPSSIQGIGRKKATWDDAVWYIQDIETKVSHRYLLIKAVKGEKRASKDYTFKDTASYESKRLTEPFSSLLKIYTLEVQSENIVNNSKQYRVVVASQIITEAEKLGGLKNVPYNFWCDKKQSNLFWSFCRERNLVPRGKRPVHSDRCRDAESSTKRNDKRLKMTSESMIYAAGDIFNRVFRDIDEDGNLIEGGSISLEDALSITVVTLGLASPDRLNSEVPLLQNQRLKKISPKEGSEIFYLDWPGSKGFSDNHNHILRALAPQINKAIGFFSTYLAPERHLVRYLKNTNLSWKDLLKGFKIEAERSVNIDFTKAPNLFSVAYVLGFFPINYEIDTINSRDDIIITNNGKKWAWRKGYCEKQKRKYQIKDMLTRKHIAQLSREDLVLRLTASGGKGLYSIQKLIMSSTFNKGFIERLNLSLLCTVKEVESAVVRIIKENIPTFPLSFGDTERGIDLESALFCISPAKHSFEATKGSAGSPLNIMSLTTLKTTFQNALMGKENFPKKNLFYKYGFGFQKLRLHSLRHFANTQAEKGGIPLSVIAAWSGRTSVNQTLEYVHTSDEEKSARLITTLDLDEHDVDIRVITRNDLQKNHVLPASLTETGVCVQELAVTPCNYINDFLSGCFGCENACYICGDESAIRTLEHDLRFQQVRLKRSEQSKESFKSQGTRDWWVIHSQGVSILEQLIVLLKKSKQGNLVRIAADKKFFLITDLNTKNVERVNLSLPSKQELLEALWSKPDCSIYVPDSMKSLIAAFRLESE